MQTRLTASGKHTLILRSKGITTWEEALDYVQAIPYGRNTNRHDFSLVITEHRGTCSSKHAFLKTVATENSIQNVDLIVGIYKMNEKNTPIGPVLSANQLNYIPEAHCYLRINKQTIDVTANHSEFDSIKSDIMEEISIEANQVSADKINIHQHFIQNWITENRIPFSLPEIWKIREECIQQLTIRNEKN